MRSLGALEAQVMNVLWSGDDAVMTGREVLAALDAAPDSKALAYTTVMTVLENLCRKGLVVRHKEGRSFRYAATVSREQYTAELLDGVLSTATDRGAALMHFVESMSEGDLEELRQALITARRGEDP